MASINDNAFEIERRQIQLKYNTNMPDSTTLGYDGNPNSVVNGSTAGESLIYNVAMGATFLQSNGNWWFKQALPNTWIQLGGATSVASNVVTYTIPAGNTQQFYSLNLTNNKNFEFVMEAVQGTDRSLTKISLLWADPDMKFNEYSVLGHNIHVDFGPSESGGNAIIEVTNREATDVTVTMKVEAFNAL